MTSPLHGFSLPCRVRSTRRQGSIALRVSHQEIRVLAPHGTPASAIERLLHERRQWIESAIATAIAEQQQRPPAPAARHYRDGESLLLGGIAYPLSTRPGPRCRLRFVDAEFVLELPRADTARERRLKAVADWYQQHATDAWPPRLQRWADYSGLTPSGLKLRRYRSRWGACTAQGLISLNTLLAMAPEAVLDYVIIHELCHLRHMNHSPAFWALVTQWCPEWRQQRRWLKNHGRALQLD
jgi:hypothetical protein